MDVRGRNLILIVIFDCDFVVIVKLGCRFQASLLLRRSLREREETEDFDSIRAISRSFMMVLSISDVLGVCGAGCDAASGPSAGGGGLLFEVDSSSS